MNSSSYFFIAIAFILSIGVGYFQYFYKTKSRDSVTYILFGLKSFSIFLLLLLFINPTIKKNELQVIKPVLSVIIDNSESIAYFKEEQEVRRITDAFKNNKQLNDKFAISYFSFGSEFKVLDSLDFLESQTNIDEGISLVSSIYKDDIAPIALITDGNQTLGNDYEFSNVSKPIYPIIIGDTTKHRDLKINQLNVNKYSYLKNNFPVECLLYYEGKESVSSRFVIRKNGKRVFSKMVSFSNTKRTATIETTLPSLETGKNYYTASIQKIKDEKNTANNIKTFSVEVIDEQTKIVLLSSVLHPDIGALKKAIETNKQRKVDVKIIGKQTYNIQDYQLAIVYQPNAAFSNVFQEIQKYKANYFIITGTKTDWRFLNNLQLGFSKNAINRTENYIADYNKNFLTFSQNDIGFNQFPPLEDKFGESLFSKPYEPLLFQNINGIAFNFPLLATLDDNGQKKAVLFGEGIWKWRAASYLNLNSFEDFDGFISNIVQYLASTKIRKRLDVNIDDVFPANTTIQATAFYVDSNYKFDDRASISIEIKNKDESIKRTLPFSVIGNSYQLSIESLPAGDYTYEVLVKDQSVSSSGTFKITNFKVEEQFTNANKEKLNSLAEKASGKAYYKTQVNQFINDLLQDERYFSRQKSIQKDRSLIDWYWLLILAILLLSLEWFIRKYYGKI